MVDFNTAARFTAIKNDDGFILEKFSEIYEDDEILELYQIFADEAAELGLETEDEILEYCVDLCKEVRW